MDTLISTSADKYLIVGDIHGCVDEFFDLLKKVNYPKIKRRIFSVGDLLDKNPGFEYTNYIELLHFFKTEKAIMVTGNHEDKHLKFERREKEGRNRMAPKLHPDKHEDFWDTRNQLLQMKSYIWDPFEWLKQFPYFQFIPGYNICVVHGGIEPGKRPEMMAPEKICRVRNIKSDGNMAHLSEITPDMPFWDELWKGPEMVVYGHSPTMQPRTQKFSLGLDTGCVYGGDLSCLLLPEGEIVSVPAREEYAELRFEME